jgi:type II secretory pathway component PulF
MVRGIDSGGSLARLLEESATMLIEDRSLRRQIIASSRTYTIMVIFAVVIGAPLLLSISTRFNDRLIDLSADISTGAEGIAGLDSGIFMSGNTIDPGFLFWISLSIILLTSSISSVLIAIISEGKEKYGLKYAVLFIPLSVGFFLIFKAGLAALF